MKILKLILFIFILMLSISSILLAQDSERVIEVRSTNNNPLELINFEINNKVFSKAETIKGDKLWLKNLKLNVKNISSKDILYLKINIEIPPQPPMRVPILLPLVFGSYAIPSKHDPNQFEIIPPLPPNQNIKISIAAEIYQSFTEFIANENQIDKITKVKYYFDYVRFTDGTEWQRGLKTTKIKATN